MTTSSYEQPPTLAGVQAAARAEEWDAVDAMLAAAIADPAIMTWAVETGIDDDDYRLRDLAVSLIEKSPEGLSAETVTKLEARMAGDENEFVRYRSAFALFAHGMRSSEITTTMDEAAASPDVADIVAAYRKENES